MRTLTNPIIENRIERQLIADIQIGIRLDAAGDVDDSKSFFRFVVRDLPSNALHEIKINVEDISQGDRGKLRAILSIAEAMAEAKNILKPGTDTDDI